MPVMAQRTWLVGGCGWLVLGAAVCAPTADAQPARPQPKVVSWQAPDATQAACYGILGEVARPGVYTAVGREVTLQEVVQQAGGLTATAAPAVRIIRQARSVQAVYFSPTGHELLQPNDVVVVDSTPDNRAGAAAPVIWLCFLGVADRPVIVPMDPRQSQLATITAALGQSPTVAETIELSTPPRMPQVKRFDVPVPNGSVLRFNSRWLVTEKLPAFPDAIPLPATTQLVSQQTIPGDPVMTLPEPTSAAPLPPQSDPTFALQVRDTVEATPVPFNAPSDDETATTPISLPVPGSRMHPLHREPKTESQQTTTPKGKVSPRIAADRNVEVFPAIDPDELAAQPTEVSANDAFSWWQMLGIGGSVACLIGIAVATRKLLDQTPQAKFPAIERRMSPPQPARIAATSPAAAMPVSDPIPPRMLEPNDLDDILRGDLTIVSEAVVFPTRFPLQRQHEPASPSFRLDAAALPWIPQPHALPTPLPIQPIAREDRAAAIPRPHIAAHKTQPVTAVQTSEVLDEFRSRLDLEARLADKPGFVKRTPVAHGSSLDRALAQLHGGLRS
jgi:hypothetical protein